MIAFVVHDDAGNIKGIAIPGKGTPDKRCGVRSHNGHTVSVVEVPEIESSKLNAHISDLIASHRLEGASSAKPARLVPKPKRKL